MNVPLALGLVLVTSIVCGVAWTGRKLPTLFSCWKKSIPGPMSERLPPLASEAEKTPATADPDESGLPLRATLFLYSGLSRSFHDFGAFGMTAWLTPNEVTPQ